MPASAVSLPDRLDADADRRVGRDGAGDHAVAGGARGRPRLAGDHRLVELGGPVDDHAVGRHASAGTDEHDVADGELARPGPSRTPSSVTTLGLVGQERREGVEGAARLADRPHLEPVAEQHDRDQRGELPPEVEVDQRRTRWPSSPRTRP